MMGRFDDPGPACGKVSADSAGLFRASPLRASRLSASEPNAVVVKKSRREKLMSSSRRIAGIVLKKALASIPAWEALGIAGRGDRKTRQVFTETDEQGYLRNL